MQEYLKMFKGLGILLVLCIMSSTMAFSEDKTNATDNQTAITNMTQVNASENLTTITNMKVANPIGNQTVTTNTTKVNASENNISTSLDTSNISNIIGAVSGTPINILTGTSSVSWEEAVKNVITAVGAMGRQVKAVQVLKFDVKLENGNIAAYEATVLLTY